MRHVFDVAFLDSTLAQKSNLSSQLALRSLLMLPPFHFTTGDL